MSVESPEQATGASSCAYWKGFCEHCDGHLEFPAQAAGSRIACPHCARTTRLIYSVMHGTTTLNRGACSSCGGHLEFAAPLTGSTAPCPHCGETTLLSPAARPVNGHLVKDHCSNCAGHLAFPSALRGQSIPCPHCGLHTTLGAPAGPNPAAHRQSPAAWDGFDSEVEPESAPARSWRRPATLATAGVLAVALLAAAWWWAPFNQRTGPDLEVLDCRLMTEASGLTYVVGQVTNHSASVFRSVRVEVDLFNAGGQHLTNVFDFNSEMPPHSVWDLKALVLEDGAADAQPVGVTGEPE